MTTLDHPTSTQASVRHGRARRTRRRRTVLVVLAVLTVAVYVATLMFGQGFYGPGDVLRVIAGENVPGASFIVGDLRLPRASLALVAGAAFGLAGVTFQTLLRNPLASPDIIGITEGASAAAAIGIITFGIRGGGTSVLAVVAGLGVAIAVYLLAYRRGGVAGIRLVLIGIAVAAMMRSLISSQLEKASNAQVAEAMRWLTGSLNGARWQEVVPVLVALAVLGALILTQTRNLAMGQLGDDAASALGVRVERTRFLVIIAAVGLICVATAATGPIAFAAFLAGPIAARIVGPHGSLLLPGAFVGALLVLTADWVGQYALGIRYPVGVVTGVLGAPYLIYLIVRTHRAGGSL